MGILMLIPMETYIALVIFQGRGVRTRAYPHSGSAYENDPKSVDLSIICAKYITWTLWVLKTTILAQNSLFN